MASLATTPVKAPQPQSAAGDALTSPMSCVGPTPERPGQDVFGPRVLGTPNGAEVDGPLALPYGAFGGMDVYGAPQAGVRPPDRLGNAPKASLQLFARQSKPAAKQETQKSSAAAGSLQSRLQRAGSFNRGVRGEQASRGAANENEVPADPAFASQPAGPSCLPADAAAAAASKYLSPSIIRQGSIIARKDSSSDFTFRQLFQQAPAADDAADGGGTTSGRDVFYALDAGGGRLGVQGSTPAAVNLLLAPTPATALPLLRQADSGWPASTPAGSILNGTAAPTSAAAAAAAAVASIGMPEQARTAPPAPRAACNKQLQQQQQQRQQQQQEQEQEQQAAKRRKLDPSAAAAVAAPPAPKPRKALAAHAARGAPQAKTAAEPAAGASGDAAIAAAAAAAAAADTTSAPSAPSGRVTRKNSSRLGARKLPPKLPCAADGGGSDGGDSGSEYEADMHEDGGSDSDGSVDAASDDSPARRPAKRRSNAATAAAANIVRRAAAGQTRTAAATAGKRGRKAAAAANGSADAAGSASLVDSHPSALPVDGSGAAAAAAAGAAVTGGKKSGTTSRTKRSRSASTASHGRYSGGGRGGGGGGGGSRTNFVRYNMEGPRSKYGGKFKTKAGTSLRKAGSRLFRQRFKAPPGAGQGSEYCDGFSSGTRCFRCGQLGHWVQECPHTTGAAMLDGPDGGPATATAAGAAAMSSAQAAAAAAAEAVAAAQPSAPQLLQLPAVADPSQPTDDELAAVLFSVWGHPGFRGQQLGLIRSALSGRSVLGVLPTGAGKSLCYQLPSLLLPGVTLVVSPLLALMKDQLEGLPAGVPAAMVCGSQTAAEVAQVLAAAAAGRLKLLYIAPEKLVSPAVLGPLAAMSPLSLVCVDEAHCVAEWGHSFRPAYLRLGHLLRHVLQPRCVMALTATATLTTQECITRVLGIPPDGVVREQPLRPNLRLQVVHSNGGTAAARPQEALLRMLAPGGQLAAASSVIVYASFQAQADEAATYLSRNGVRARCYHAGKAQHERASVQADFCSGRCRVVVATVAFGMGVDKSRVDAVVHLSLPRSLEEYVQQVGRAGRDGSEATCITFLDADDHLRLRSLSSSGAVTLAAVEGFLREVFFCKSGGSKGKDGGGGNDGSSGLSVGQRYGVLPLAAAGASVDMGEETMETLLSHLQSGAAGSGDHCDDNTVAAGPANGSDTVPGGDHGALVSVYPNTGASVDVFFHATPPEGLAGRHPVVAALLAARPKVLRGAHKVGLPALVAAGRMPSTDVFAGLVALARQQEIRFEVSKQRALSWQVHRVPSDLPALAARLHARLVRQERLSAWRLDLVYSALAAAARLGPSSGSQEAALRDTIMEYFGAEDAEASLAPDAALLPLQRPPTLRGTVQAFLATQASTIEQLLVPMSGVAVARVLHGLPSPAFPADQWRQCRTWWGTQKAVDFRLIVDIADEVLAEQAAAARRKTKQAAAAAAVVSSSE